MTIEKLNKAMDEVNSQNKSSDVTVQGGKKYTKVVTRVEVLRRNFGFDVGITTDIREFMGGVLVHACVVGKEGNSIGEGHAYVTGLSKNKGLENTESTAVGRALAACGLAGGEYATQNEMETWEERYEEKPEEEVKYVDADLWLTKDIRWRIRECDNLVDLQTTMDEHESEIKDLHDDLQCDIYETQSEVMRLIENDTFVQNNTYVFGSVPHGLKYGGEAKKDIEVAADKKWLEAWFARWMGKLRELDTVLKADKYQTPEGSPYVRIQKLYADKLEELTKPHLTTEKEERL